MNRGHCLLCLRDDQKIVESHIISNLFYKPLKEKEGRFYVISTDPAKPERPLQKGITGPMLCEHCDNVVVERNESYLRKLIFGGTGTFMRDGGRVLSVWGFDYKMLKNELLSLLWRMHQSAHPFFAGVELVPDHAERIRRILLEDQALAEDHYPVSFAAPLLNGKFFSDIILAPDCVEEASGRIYRCLIAGFIFVYFVSDGPLDSRLRPFVLHADELPIMRAEARELPFLADILAWQADAIGARAARKRVK